MKKLFLCLLLLSLPGCSTFTIDLSSSKKVLKGVDSFFIVKPDIKNESGADLSEVFASALAFSLKKKNYRVESYFSGSGEEKNYRYKIIFRGAVLKSGGVFDAAESSSLYAAVFDSAESVELALVRVLCTECGLSDAANISRICSGIADKIDNIVSR